MPSLFLLVEFGKMIRFGKSEFFSIFWVKCLYSSDCLDKNDYGCFDITFTGRAIWPTVWLGQSLT